MGTSVTPPENLKTGAVAERTLFPVGGPVVSLFIFVAVWVAVVGEVVVAAGMFKKGGRDEGERKRERRGIFGLPIVGYGLYRFSII